jgi:hypothetical protein
MAESSTLLAENDTASPDTAVVLDENTNRRMNNDRSDSPPRVLPRHCIDLTLEAREIVFASLLKRCSAPGVLLKGTKFHVCKKVSRCRQDCQFHEAVFLPTIRPSTIGFHSPTLMGDNRRRLVCNFHFCWRQGGGGSGGMTGALCIRCGRGSGGSATSRAPCIRQRGSIV